ncbi:hypothetical protein [Streptomyces bobili]|uniref:hypothetical protein n=1 Tax=Streptomyces bobili TaxID=67280 RepID=UPI000A3C19AD|nr:hypothetical protein [Streptomyces bobili]
MKPAQTEEPSNITQRAGIAFCAWHEAYSNSARLVRDSSGARLFACYSCREAYDLPLVADQPCTPAS